MHKKLTLRECGLWKSWASFPSVLVIHMVSLIFFPYFDYICSWCKHHIQVSQMVRFLNTNTVFEKKKILQILQKLSSGVNSGTNFAEADHEIFCYKILVFIWGNTWETCKHILFKVSFMFACVTLYSIIPTLKIVPKSFDFNQLPKQIFISKIKKPFPFARAWKILVLSLRIKKM